MKISFHFVWLLSPTWLRGQAGAGAWPGVGCVALLMQRSLMPGEFISKVAKRKAEAAAQSVGGGREVGAEDDEQNVDADQCWTSAALKFYAR